MKITGQLEAIRILNSGKALIFQTDTLPAIGCKPEYSDMIYRVKKRDKNKALILMGSQIQQVLPYVDNLSKEDFQKIAEKFWPGPLTLIVPFANSKRLNFISNENTIGIRIPHSASAQSLILKTGPLATSSANISGITTSCVAESVAADLPEIDILGPVPWKRCSGVGSTIISWKAKGEWELVRKGQIPISSIF